MIEILETAVEVRAYKAKLGKAKLALVPTMGNLHEGHLQLVKLAQAQAQVVMVSIFVNPTQFAPNEDLASYPRTFDEDLEKLKNLGVDAVFFPATQDIYPFGKDSTLSISLPNSIMGILCAKDRPSHFQGVATVVTKLFTIIQPQVAVFGEKDYQQQVIIKRLVAELFLDIDIVVAPIVREPSGLAMSSRNQYLSPIERNIAPRIQQTLQSVREALLIGLEVDKVLANAVAALTQHNIKVEYLELRNKHDLSPEDLLDEAILLIATRVGQTRLIDNLPILKP